jgi:metal-responsive CopG/Arc/MetJ family transcriptional regulator
LGSKAEGLKHMVQVADNRHDQAAYMFGIITAEYNNSAVEVEEALVHVHKFIMMYLADRTI